MWGKNGGTRFRSWAWELPCRWLHGFRQRSKTSRRQVPPTKDLSLRRISCCWHTPVRAPSGFQTHTCLCWQEWSLWCQAPHAPRDARHLTDSRHSRYVRQPLCPTFQAVCLSIRGVAEDRPVLGSWKREGDQHFSRFDQHFSRFVSAFSILFRNFATEIINNLKLMSLWKRKKKRKCSSTSSWWTTLTEEQTMFHSKTGRLHLTHRVNIIIVL